MSKGSSRLGRFMRSPIRVLGRACDLYVRSMTGCADRMQQGMLAIYPTDVPRSFSYNSVCGDDEDIREFIRAASQQAAAPAENGALVMPKSRSMAVGRIDEDEVCEFGGDLEVGASLLFARSKSCAVASPGRRSKNGVMN